MDSRLSDEQSFLLYLAKYDRPRHLRLWWRLRPLNSACADGLKLGSTNLTSDYPAIKSDPRSTAILIWSALVKQKLVDQIGWPRIVIQIKLDLDWWNAPLVERCCCILFICQCEAKSYSRLPGTRLLWICWQWRLQHVCWTSRHYLKIMLFKV